LTPLLNLKSNASKSIYSAIRTSQSAGVATFFVAVNCNESITRKSSLEEEEKSYNENKL